MKDPFGREITYMRISVTDRCNLRCIYCMPVSGVTILPKSQYLSCTEVLSVVRAGLMLGIDKIRITGGEPLVRRDLPNLIYGMKKMGVRDVSLSTNGLLFKSQARNLKEAGLDRVNFSLDTLHPDRFRKIARLCEDPTPVLEAVDSALDLGLAPVKLNMVTMRGYNDDEIGDMARLTIDRPLHVRYIELMPFSEAHNWSADALVPSQEVRERLTETWPDLEPADGEVRGNGPARYYRIPGAQGTVGFITAMTQCFCAGCNRVRLSADGKLNTCLGHLHEVDLRPALRRPDSTDEMVRAEMERAIANKPREHDFAVADTEARLRAMHGIGG